MHLTRTAIEYFDRPWEYMNYRQSSAREAVLKWIHGRSMDLHSSDKWSDTAKLISAFEMRQLWKNFNELLFGDRIDDSEFHWKHDCHNLGEARGGEFRGKRTLAIFMNPKKAPMDMGSHRVLKPLSTALHEIVYVFFARHRCRNCRTLRDNLKSDCHGRPFQLLATKIEEVVPRLLGIPVNLGRFRSYTTEASWADTRTLPS
jgi:hypothetical protein